MKVKRFIASSLIFTIFVGLLPIFTIPAHAAFEDDEVLFDYLKSKDARSGSSYDVLTAVTGSGSEGYIKVGDVPETEYTLYIKITDKYKLGLCLEHVSYGNSSGYRWDSTSDIQYPLVCAAAFSEEAYSLYSNFKDKIALNEWKNIYPINDIGDITDSELAELFGISANVLEHVIRKADLTQILESDSQLEGISIDKVNFCRTVLNSIDEGHYSMVVDVTSADSQSAVLSNHLQAALDNTFTLNDDFANDTTAFSEAVRYISAKLSTVEPENKQYITVKQFWNLAGGGTADGLDAGYIELFNDQQFKDTATAIYDYFEDDWGATFRADYNQLIGANLTSSSLTQNISTAASKKAMQAFYAYAAIGFRSQYTDTKLFNTISGASEATVGDEYGKYYTQVLKAKTELSTMRENPALQRVSSYTDNAHYWVQRMYLSLGVAVGLIDRKDLTFIDTNTTAVPLVYVQQPNQLLDPTTLVYGDKAFDSIGIYAFYLEEQELAYFSFMLVNIFAATCDDNNKYTSFSRYQKDLKCLKEIYDMLIDLNDDALWEAWRSTEFDMRSDAKTKYSLAMIYEYLVSNNAFADLDYTTDVDAKNPFTYFFSDSHLSGDLQRGIAASAQFIPMHTNVYDPYTWRDIVPTSWLLNYYAKFGYFRKALYIDNNPDAAVNFANTKGKGNVSVATLEDLLQDKDIVLYLDDNLYNVDKLAELMNKAWDYMQNTPESGEANGESDGWTWRHPFTSLASAINRIATVSMPELAKSPERTSYSTRVPAKVENSPYWDSVFLPLVQEETNTGSNAKDTTSMTSEAADAVKAEESERTIDETDTIVKYLYPDDVWSESGHALKENAESTEYSTIFAFAVLSGVYRDSMVKNRLNRTLNANNPVFISSATAPFVSEELRSSILNYMLVRNLSSQMTVDYATSLDMTSPLYMDVFGNILTESGYVVIPAAANATLFSSSEFDVRNAAFCSCYGASEYLEYTDTEAAKDLNAYLEKHNFAVVDDNWVMKSITTSGGKIDLARFATVSKDALKSLSTTIAYDLDTGILYTGKLSLWQVIITEVLRGAPIEYIDKDKEGIGTNVTYTRAGLFMADKLELLVTALSPAGQNASISIPNPAYIDGIEIVVFFIYKLLILFTLVAWMITIYVDATGGHLNLQTGGKCIAIIILVLALIIGVPKCFEYSYYESNKYLLQDETQYLMMLNLEKEQNGQEIGVTKITEPRTSTKLYLKLSEVNMPWWDILINISTSAGYSSLDEMYENYENQHPLAYSKQATTMNGNIYISTDDLFDSAKVQFSPLTDMLYVTGAEDTPASYYTPYYYMLKVMTDTISQWSKDNNCISYTTKLQRGGELKTLGYTRMFFESEDFMAESTDWFRLYKLYNIPSPRQYMYPSGLTEEMLDQNRNAQWCNADSGLMVSSYQRRIDKLNTYATTWIAKNRGMIGKVTDETFLKCFCLACAMEHNKIFNTMHASYLEIQQLSNEDLLRLSIADRTKVLSTSSQSYARFVYTTGGVIAVYLAAILELVNFVNAWVKPICTLLVFLIACISIFVMKLILRHGNNSVYGYIVTILLMCSVNVLGAFITKLSMLVPTFGTPPAICIIINIFIEVVYMSLQLKIISYAVKDWSNVGFQRYEHGLSKIHIGNRNRKLSENTATPIHTTGYEMYDRMLGTRMLRQIKA